MATATWKARSPVKNKSKSKKSEPSDYSRESEDLLEEPSKSEDLDGSKASKSTQTPSEFSDTITDTLSGMMSELTTENQEPVISLLGDSLALEHPALESEQDLATQNQDSGGNFTELSESVNPGLSALNSQRDSGTGDSEKSSDALPKSGTWVSGNLSQQPILERLILESESLLLPTPTTYPEGSGESRSAGSNKLEQALRRLPTPVARDHKGVANDTLPESIQPHIQQGEVMNPAVPGWMMGFPPGYAESALMDGGEQINHQQTQECQNDSPSEESASPSMEEVSPLSKQRSPLPESSTSGSVSIMGEDAIDNQLSMCGVGELVDIGEAEPATVLEIHKNTVKVRCANGAVKWRNLSEIAPVQVEETASVQSEDAVNSDGLLISLIRTDGGTQMREKLNSNYVDSYSFSMRMGAVFPPVIVFYDGTQYWCADGHHRVAAAAAQLAELKRFQADIRMGTQRDAVLFACTEANTSEAHETAPLRLTREDKNRRVAKLLSDPEWMKWSDTTIAEKAKVSQSFVSKKRKELGAYCEQRTYTRDGVVYTMDVSGIGKPPETPPLLTMLDEIVSGGIPESDLVEAGAIAPSTSEPTLLIQTQPEINWENKLSEFGFSKSIYSAEEAKAEHKVADYKGWQIYFEIPNGGITACVICNQDSAFDFPVGDTPDDYEFYFDYTDSDGVLSHAKKAIDAVSGDQPSQSVTTPSVTSSASAQIQPETEKEQPKKESKDSDEQYTPEYIWRLGLEMLGIERYDLDPFSNSKTNPNVPALVIYTKEDNGLIQPWKADSVWVNPPYSCPGDCIEKIIQEYVDKLIDNVFILVQSDNSTKWYQALLELALVCLVDHRIKFINPDNTSAARFASSLFYLGDKVNDFVRHFDKRCNPKGLGFVVQPLTLPGGENNG